MAVGASLLTAGGSAVTGSSFNTASVTPTGNELILLWVMAGAAVGSSQPNTVTGNGLTWVEITHNVVNQPIAVWRAMGASPSGGAVTIGFPSAQDEVDWVIVDYSGVDTSGTNGSGAIVQFNNAQATATTLTVTLSGAIGGGNAVAAAVGQDGGTAQTAGSGYTKLGENSAGTIVGDLAHVWAAVGTTTPSTSWSGTHLATGLAVEIKAAAAAAADDYDPLWRYRVRPPGLLAPNPQFVPTPLGDMTVPGPPAIWIPDQTSQYGGFF